MKLLLCKSCTDVVRLQVKEPRTCRCAACCGMYLDDVNAVYSGPAFPLGFDNGSLARAAAGQPQKDDRGGVEFKALVIPAECATFKRVDDSYWDAAETYPVSGPRGRLSGR